jgi:hypothetical protein
MINDQQYKEWLLDDTALRCVLVETTAKLGGVDTPIRLASRGYTTGPNDTPPNAEYLEILETGVTVNEQLSVSGNATMSYGDIELDNSDGEYDHWFAGVWANRPLTVYLGDVRWPRTWFKAVFAGVVADIDSRSRNRLNIKFRDKLQLLNTSVNEVKLGGETENKERLLPVLFGECHNIEPLLVDPANHEYQVNIGQTERIIEVRDDGAPIAITATLGTGKFRLDANPFGTITASAQGTKIGGYTNSIVGIIKQIVKNYGLVQHRFSDDDLDLASLAAFDAANPAPVGYYVPDKENVLEVCQQLASSVGAMVMVSRLGKLKLTQLNLPTSGSVATITPDEMVNRTLKVVDKLEVSAAVKLGYCRNWSVQSNIETGIPTDHKDLYKKEWLDVTVEDTAVASDYKLHIAPEREETYLLTTAHAVNEAARRLTIRKVPRCIYEYVGFADSMALELGSVVTIFHDRFNLDNGKLAVVVGLQPNFLKSRTTVQVMI